MTADATATRDLVTVVPVFPKGPGIAALKTGDDTMARAGNSQAGWVTADRGRRMATAGWTGLAPYELTLPLILNGVGPVRQDSVEPLLARLESWRQMTAATGLPPVLTVTGPTIAPAGTRWVLEQIEYGDRMRHNGLRVQQSLSLLLLQYVSPTLVQSPAKKHRHRHGHDPASS